MKLPADKRVIYILFLNGASLFLSLVSVFVLSRLITVEDFGLFNFYTYIGGFFILFNSLSCELYIVMSVGRDKHLTNIVYNTFINLRTMFSILLLVGFYVYTIYFGMQIYSFIIVFAILLNSYLSGHFIPFLRLIDKVNIGLIAQSAQVIIFTGLVVIFDKTLFYVAMSYLLSIIVTVLPVYLYLDSVLQVPYIFKIDWSHVKKSLKYFFNQLIDLIYIRLDVIFVQLFLGLQVLGIYTAGVKLNNALLMLPQTLLFVFVPDLHKAKDDDKLNFEYTKFTNYIVEIGSVFCIILFYFKDDLVKILYGDKFVALNELMPLFLLNLFFVILSYPNLLMLEIKLLFRKRFVIKVISIVVLMILMTVSLLRPSQFSVLYAIIVSNFCYFLLSMYVLKNSVTGVLLSIVRKLAIISFFFILIEIVNFYYYIGQFRSIPFVVMCGALFLIKRKNLTS